MPLPTITSNTSKAILATNIAVAVGLNTIDQLTQTQLVPPKYQSWLLVAQLVFQAVMTQLAHRSNPDGTPAQAPWIKKP